MKKCELCPRNCLVDRSEEKGFCGETKMRVAHTMLHKWEEPIISGEKGSGAIFFSGCNLKCVYCQNYELSRSEIGEEVDYIKLSQIIKTLEEDGAENINFVTPTHFADGIIESLKCYKPKVPVVYNTSGYETISAIEKLNGFVDIFLTDLRYYSNESSVKYSKTPNYFKYASKALLAMRKMIPTDIVENGKMKKGIIVRILVLPSLTDEAIKILEWIKENLGENTIISIMNQYIPMGKSYKYPEINRKLTPIEYKRVVSRAISLGFKNAFIQEESSAELEFVPEFKKK